jgi:CHAD domain-containing protein
MTEQAGLEGDGSPSGAEMLTARLRELVARLRELDPQVRDGAEDSVHDMRVTVRRLRSTLTSYAPAFDESESGAARSELRWLEAQLGEVRDPEVQSGRLRELGDAAAGVRAELDAAHAEARERLTVVMDQPRYAALLDRLSVLADDPPFTDVARLPAAELVRARAHKDWRRVRTRVGSLPAPDDEAFTEHLHEVRKSAKRMQYLLESGRFVAGDDARRLRRRLQSFQRRLGDHHDAALTSELLAEAGESSTAAEEEAAAVAEEFPSLWRRVSKRARQWLRSA